MIALIRRGFILAFGLSLAMMAVYLTTHGDHSVWALWVFCVFCFLLGAL
jgi:hypothetical protein